MTFGAPEWFWALLALPVLFLLYWQAERQRSRKLREFISERLLPQLAGRVDRFRRALRFILQLLGLALAVVALAQPRWGYTFEEAHRKGIDLLIAVDTSRSMLSNDVQPNRLERVKLATQDLINQLQGDRVGLIAFAGRAFVQAPLTIDYGAVVEAINDLDTKTIPEGGTNISEAISLATTTYGKSATGNRALVIFTDGEELSGDATKAAKTATDSGVKIFTVGVGTSQGSLIPVPGDDAGNSFVKDSKGQVVKSKLDEKRLREIAETAGGFYLHLENGPQTMQRLINDGIGKMEAGEIDVRMSRRPIERFEWPLSGAIALLSISLLVGERKRIRQPARSPARKAVALAPATAALLLLCASSAFATAPGLNEYRGGNYEEALKQFQETLKAHPQTSAADKLEFDSGTAAYKLNDYNKALESFSQALLSPDPALQSKSHYNLGNTLYQRGEKEKGDEKKLTDWNNALQHYEQTLKLDPQNKEAKENYEFVKRKIDELKNKQQPTPTPSPSPQQKQNKQDKKKSDQNQDQSKQQQQQDQQKDQQQQDQNQQQQQQQQQSSSQDQQQDQQQQQQKDQQQQKGDSNSQQNQQQKENKDQSDQKKDEKSKQDQSSPSPSPGQSPSPSPNATPTPSPGGGEKKDDQASPSPTPGGENEASPSPSPGEGEGEGSDEGVSPSPSPNGSPPKKFAGDIKGSSGEANDKQQPEGEAEVEELEKEGQMSRRQAEALLQSMKDEEARVQLDEHKVRRHVYNDW